MKAVILAGGLGSRMSEETGTRPKPLVEIGGHPILWHIMKIYAAHGVADFVICLGYKGHLIKEFFSSYALRMADVSFDLANGSMQILRSRVEDWKVALIDTGDSSMTGGRLARVYDYVKDEPFFHFTYGDCVGNIDIRGLEQFHKEHGKLATVTAVRPPGRFGSLELDGNAVTRFTEKPAGDGGLINAGYFVLSPEVIPQYVGSDDTCVWEQKPLERLAADGQLVARKHSDFWRPMDTLRDKTQLEQMWAQGAAPWKVW